MDDFGDLSDVWGRGIVIQALFEGRRGKKWGAAKMVLARLGIGKGQLIDIGVPCQGNGRIGGWCQHYGGQMKSARKGGVGGQKKNVGRFGGK